MLKEANLLPYKALQLKRRAAILSSWLSRWFGKIIPPCYICLVWCNCALYRGWEICLGWVGRTRNEIRTWCLSNELRGTVVCMWQVLLIFLFYPVFYFYNLQVSSLVRVWEMSQAHTSSLFSPPPSFLMLYTVVFLMCLVTDQLSAGVQHNYVSFCISTFLRIHKHYGDETKQTVTIPSLPELILSKEKSYSSSILHLNNLRVWQMHVCVFRANVCLDKYFCEGIFLSNVLQVCVPQAAQCCLC